MPVSDYSIRRASIADADIIGRHRVAMFQEMGDVSSSALATELLRTSVKALQPLLADGGYVGWLAVDRQGAVIAGAGVHVKAQLPRMSLDRQAIVTAALPLVVNVYTEMEWRGRGVARALMRVVMDWAIAEGFDRLVLHASDAGRHLYESLGFAATNEMRWAANTPPKG